MGRYELTKRQWLAVMGTLPWAGQPFIQVYPESPAVYVSWNDAQDFVGAINVLTDKNFRLPAEAEWEYACRAGETARFYYGDDPSYAYLGNHAWWDGNANSAGQQYAHVVGLKEPNAWRLARQLHGRPSLRLCLGGRAQGAESGGPGRQLGHPGRRRALGNPQQ
jgi:formylglycine-generating enzyme required for sulfatase activity